MGIHDGRAVGYRVQALSAAQTMEKILFCKKYLDDAAEPDDKAWMFRAAPSGFGHVTHHTVSKWRYGMRRRQSWEILDQCLAFLVNS